jgi:hypothetical protein
VNHDWFECGLSHSNMFIYKCKNCDSRVTSSLRPDPEMVVIPEFIVDPIRRSFGRMTCDQVIAARITLS